MNTKTVFLFLSFKRSTVHLDNSTGMLYLNTQINTIYPLNLISLARDKSLHVQVGMCVFKPYNQC